jgi:hypothetical protein
MLLIDNCSNYILDDAIAILIRERVRIITFAPHVIHMFQMFDVKLFGALEKHATSFETLDEESQAAAFFLKVYRDFKQMMVEVNIWGAFAAIGFIHDIYQIPYGPLFDKEKFR